MQKKKFSTKIDTCYQTKWIKDQAPRNVGPDLDPYCLQMSFKINILVEFFRKYFYFVQELLEGTVCVTSSAKTCLIEETNSILYISCYHTFVIGIIVEIA